MAFTEVWPHLASNVMGPCLNQGAPRKKQGSGSSWNFSLYTFLKLSLLGKCMNFEFQKYSEKKLKIFKAILVVFQKFN